jgi:transposase
MTNSSIIALASMSRHRKRKRALRDAINQRRELTPEQVKLAVAEVEALSKTIAELTAQSNKWPSQENVSDREMNALMKHADELTAQLRARTTHPQVKAVLLAREKKAGRRS